MTGIVVEEGSALRTGRGAVFVRRESGVDQRNTGNCIRAFRSVRFWNDGAKELLGVRMVAERTAPRNAGNCVSAWPPKAVVPSAEPLPPPNSRLDRRRLRVEAG
jgi:hypothetical protein